MTFNALWFEYIKSDNLFGCGLLGFKNWDTESFRNFLSVYYQDGLWILNILWLEFVI
jgi:hypothetical protein